MSSRTAASLEEIEVAALADLPPGRLLRVEVGGRGIVLANATGTVYAVDDLCTHEDASLATGLAARALSEVPAARKSL